MDKARKQVELKYLQDNYADNTSMVVVENKGLSVKDATQLRKELRESGVVFKTVKNTLARLAAKGTQFEAATDLFKGPTSVALAKDPVAAAKVLHNFAKTNDKLVILGGALDGQKLDAKSVETLAKLPGLNELRGKIVGLLQAPATKIAGVLQAPAGQLARVVGAFAAKG
ncbi:MAG: 50S ribosomal protein L10 [Alphaproteobacteria bacterium]|nr:50S ribosomal protein L10 [Alphaproteobacteria bacterium]